MATCSQPTTLNKVSNGLHVPDSELTHDDQNDSYTDDDSFDTFTDSSYSEEERIEPPPLPPRSSRTSSVCTETNVRGWLSDQRQIMRNGLQSSSRSATTDTASCSSAVSVPNDSTSAPERPPKLNRTLTASSSDTVRSNDTVKRRPPPPVVPAESSETKARSTKKQTKQNPVAVASSERESQKDPQPNTRHKPDKSSHSKHQGKSVLELKKNRDLGIHNGNYVANNVLYSENSPPSHTFDNSSWTVSDMMVNEQYLDGNQLIRNTAASFSPARPGQPLVFEKVAIQDDQIADDYLFHRSVAELTSASAENIVECVGRQMSSESSPAPHSSPGFPPLENSNGLQESPNTRSSPQPVFQYAPVSSVRHQTSSVPNNIQHHPTGLVQQSRPQIAANQVSPVAPEPKQQWMKNGPDIASEKSRYPNQPVSSATPLQLSRSETCHSQVSPDRLSSFSSFDNFDDDKLNKHDSGVSDDLTPAYGLNRRTLTLKSGGKVGFSLCGGNVSGTFIRSVVVNSAAAAAGLSAGDWIIAINRKVVKSFTKQEVLQLIEKLAPDSVKLVLDRDDDRFKLASSKNAVGDSFHVRAHFSHMPSVRGRELAVLEGDVFQVSDSLPEDAVGYWVAKKISGVTGESEGLIPNCQKAEQIITKQRLAAQTATRPRGGSFMRSFRRSKSYERCTDPEHLDAFDSKQSSECGDIVPYVRVVEQSSSVRRPVVVMGLFCEPVCSKLEEDSPEIFAVPKKPVEKRLYGADFSPSAVDVATVRSVVNSGRHCLMVISPRAVRYFRDKTELQPIVIYMSPSSKSVLKSMIQQLAPDCVKKPSFLLEEATKFERYHTHTGLFDAVIPYKVDSSWFSLVKDTVGRLQRHPRWIPYEPEDKFIAHDSSSPGIIRTTRTVRIDGQESKRLSRTTDDIPDKIQDLIARHVNVVSPMISDQSLANTNDLCTQSFDFGDRDMKFGSKSGEEPVDGQTVLIKPPKSALGNHADVVLRKPRTRGRAVSNKESIIRVTDL